MSDSRRIVVLVSLLLAGSLSALAADEIPAAAIADEASLMGAARIRYLLRQVDLLPEQMSKIEKMAGEELPDRLSAEAGLDEVRRIYQEIEAEQAKGAQGDQTRIEELAKRLHWLGADGNRDRTFLSEIEPMLNDEQRAALEAARDRLRRNPSGGLRLIDLAYAARAQGLTAEQERGVQQAILDSREHVGAGMKQTLAQRIDGINFCLTEIRKVLTPEQQPEFDRTVARLRPDLVDDGFIGAAAGDKAGK